VEQVVASEPLGGREEKRTERQKLGQKVKNTVDKGERTNIEIKRIPGGKLCSKQTKQTLR
jgi:hypothetical protein